MQFQPSFASRSRLRFACWIASGDVIQIANDVIPERCPQAGEDPSQRYTQTPDCIAQQARISRSERRSFLSVWEIFPPKRKAAGAQRIQFLFNVVPRGDGVLQITLHLFHRKWLPMILRIRGRQFLQLFSPWKFGTSHNRTPCSARFGGIRISKSARYENSFTPKKLHAKDKDTLLP